MSYENEMKQAFRQLGPLGEREACEIAATADAEIAALKQRVAELERELAAARKEANVAAKKIVAALDKRWPNLNIEGWDNEEAAGIVAAALEKESNAKR